MRLLLLAIAIVGAYAQNDGYEFQECPDNIPEELIAFGAQEGINEMYDKDIQPLFELVLFDLEQGYTPFESHTVGLVANDKEQPFSQFTVTVENIDEKCSPGVLKATNSRTREIKSCPNVIVNSDDLSETHTKVSFRWKAPECGCVLIRATIASEDMEYFYLENPGEFQGPLTKTVCPVGTRPPTGDEMIDLTDDDIVTLETVDAMMQLSEEELELVKEITDTIAEEDFAEIPGLEEDIEMGEMAMMLFNEVCSQERQTAPLSEAKAQSSTIYPCCRVKDEERLNCFLTREHPDDMLESIADIRLAMVCSRVILDEDDEMTSENPVMVRCCNMENSEDRKQCFERAKNNHYEKVCRGDNVNLFFTLQSALESPNDDHICCAESDEERNKCFDEAERKELFPREETEEEMMDKMDGRRLNRVCKRLESDSDRPYGGLRRPRRPRRMEILRECCGKPEGERRECIRRRVEEKIDRVCSGEENDLLDLDEEYDEDVNALMPRIDRRDRCCEKTGEERYQCFKKMRCHRFKMSLMEKMSPSRPGPVADMILSRIEDGRIERICNSMQDGSMDVFDVKEDLLECCKMSSPERTECFKTAERQHLTKVCKGEEMQYVFRIGHFGEEVEEEDMDDVVTIDNPCCQENDEERVQCFDIMGRMHLWEHKPRHRPMMRPRLWRRPEDLFNDAHREVICRKVSEGRDEEVEMELENDAIEDFEPMPSERRWRGRERNEETMNAMQRCCEMEGEESRQCMLETRKLKNNILCDKMTEEMKDTSTMPAWKQEFMTSRLGCCEKTGEERHKCFSDIPNRRQMKPNPRQFWQDPENRFNEEHRDRICERIVEDEDVSQIERELDEDVATDNEKLSIGMMLKNFNKMLTFFYQKMTKDNDLMDKMTECCFVDDDDEARACFEDSRKMRIDNMCEMVNENSEAEDDDDVMSRPSFWVQEKTRCCAMEGEGRYTCIDELRQRGMGRPGMDGQPGLSRPGRWWGQGRPQMSRPYFPEMGSKTGEEYRIPSGMDKPKWEMGKPGRQGRPGRRQQMKEEKLESSQEFGRRRGPPTRGEIDPKKVDDFCDTPVARTAILMGMPKRPGFPPALCCQQDEDNMEERYRCFRERLREIRLAPEFDFTPDQPQTEDIGKTYWSSDEKPVQKPERDENPMVDIYESAESREDEDDNGEEHSCCRVGRAVGTKIDDFRFIRCEAKSIQLSKKRQSSRACRRAFVRCCVGRRDRNEE